MSGFIAARIVAIFPALFSTNFEISDFPFLDNWTQQTRPSFLSVIRLASFFSPRRLIIRVAPLFVTAIFLAMSCIVHLFILEITRKARNSP